MSRLTDDDGHADHGIRSAPTLADLVTGHPKLTWKRRNGDTVFHPRMTTRGRMYGPAIGK